MYNKEEKVNLLRQAFAMDTTIEEAVFFAGISKQTLYDWYKEEPGLKEKLDELRHSPVLKARQTVIEAIEKDKETAKWYLEKKKKDEFGKESNKLFDKDDIRELTEFFRAAAKPDPSDEIDK